MLLRYLPVSQLCGALGKLMLWHLGMAGEVSLHNPWQALGNGSQARDAPVLWSGTCPYPLSGSCPVAPACQAEQAVMAEHPARAGLLKGDPGHLAVAPMGGQAAS